MPSQGLHYCVREISSMARATCHGVSFMSLFLLLLRELLRIRVQVPECWDIMSTRSVPMG